MNEEKEVVWLRRQYEYIRVLAFDAERRYESTNSKLEQEMSKLTKLKEKNILHCVVHLFTITTTLVLLMELFK